MKERVGEQAGRHLSFIDNWDAVAAGVMNKTLRELGALERRSEEDESVYLEAMASGVKQLPPAAMIPAGGELWLSVRFGRDEMAIDMFSTITTFGTPFDMTLQDLRIETLYPVDSGSRAALMRLVSGPVQ